MAAYDLGPSAEGASDTADALRRLPAYRRSQSGLFHHHVQHALPNDALRPRSETGLQTVRLATHGYRCEKLKLVILPLERMINHPHEIRALFLISAERLLDIR